MIPMYNTKRFCEIWDNVDDFRWVEEEELFIEWGGVYYEDLN